MAQKFYKTKEAIKEIAKWNKKLKKSGFEDIEQDENYLKVWSDSFSRSVSLESYKFKEAYYYMATHFLNDYTFDTKLDKIIWEYHANGISVRNISLLLEKVRIKAGKTTVFVTIKRLKALMRELYKKDGNEQI